VNVEVQAVFLQRRAVEVGDLPHALSNHTHGIVKRCGRRQPFPRAIAAAKHRGHGLRERKASAGEHGNGSFTGRYEGEHLAAGVDLVVACIAARIRRKKESLMSFNAYAIGHGDACTRLRCISCLHCGPYAATK